MPLTPPHLWIVATPLGNPGDLSPRARAVLEAADFVLAEDTRRAGLLCQRCGVTVQRFVSCHDHNEAEKAAGIIRLLQEGKTAAFISDAGTPVMADPGFRLVRAAREAGLRVSAVPGPCAPVTALSAAGIAPQPFTFFGFLPRETSDQEKTLAPFARLSTTVVFFERKDRLKATLATVHSLFGKRELAICRELTKDYEEFILTRLEDFAALPDDLLGEITVIVGQPEGDVRSPREQVLAHLAQESQRGGKPRDIARRVQQQVTGWTGKELYLLLSEQR